MADCNAELSALRQGSFPLAALMRLLFLPVTVTVWIWRAVPFSARWLETRFPLFQPILQITREALFLPMVLICPLPIGPIRRHLAGKITEQGDFVFYCHPRLIVCMHLIWVGWLVGLTALLQGSVAEPAGWDLGWLMRLVTWLWIVTLVVTIIALSLDLGRLSVAMLIVATAGLAAMLGFVQARVQLPILGAVIAGLAMIPIEMEWGLPVLVSLLIGLWYTTMAGWKRLDDFWVVSPKGNYIEHRTFERGGDHHPYEFKVFRATWPCLLKKYLCFGYGNIEIRDNHNSGVIATIEGCLHARGHERMITERFRAYEVTPVRRPPPISDEEEIVDRDIDP